ncbi:maleylpyruvate isomerase family mycothiol-dependent enzyme [Mycobacterium paraintracellulare]|uniref:maleylpyruvate isomerase family mycothiol-dependent enzyme n=1 Tax=Mycobacterium paraintracellulare TaxID=1138383 RepID=UPI0019164DEB|nr:maleylpyruvate isomerase family mycothiol-dependent enzyme [Mycobacterium paraintracellulare]
MTDAGKLHPGLSCDEHIDALETEGQLMCSLAETAEFEAAIPFCPGWMLADLITHVGFIYRWVGAIVGEIRDEPPSESDRAALQDPDPTDRAGTLTRLRSAHRDVLRLLRDAPSSLDCWTVWTHPSPRTFWTRRMLHETLIHRVDAQNAVIASPMGGHELPAALAADGVDEMICGFARRYAQTLRSEHGSVLALTATDTGQRWWAKIGSHAPEFGRGTPPLAADTEVRALAGELLLLLWNRRTANGLAVHGRGDVLETWAQKAHL